MSSKRKILFVIDKLGVGGTELQLVEIMKRLDPEKHEVFICCLSGSESGISEYIPPERYKKTLLLDVRTTYSVGAAIALFRIMRFIRFEGIDVVQGYFLKSRFLGMLAGKLAGCRTIACARDLGLSVNVKNGLALKGANMCTDRFLVNSESTRTYLMERQNVTARKIDLIRNGVDFARFQAITEEERSDWKRKLDIDPDTVVIGAIANLRKVKGLTDFIQAAAVVLRKRKPVHFVIVGDGPLRDDLEREATALGVRDKILFVGRCLDVRPYLLAFDIAVSTSLTEGFSNAILEYMATGLPIIATRIGGNQEQIEHGRTGLFVAPGDWRALATSMSLLIDNPEIRLRLGKNALDHCRNNYSMETMVYHLEQYYSGLCHAGDQYAG